MFKVYFKGEELRKSKTITELYFSNIINTKKLSICSVAPNIDIWTCSESAQWRYKVTKKYYGAILFKYY